MPTMDSLSTATNKSFLAPHQRQKEAIKDKLYAYLKKKKKAEDVTQETKKHPKNNNKKDDEDKNNADKNQKEIIDPVFVHQLLSNPEKLHFYALVELLRLDLRLALEHTTPTPPTSLDEGVLKEAAQIEADLTALLTSIGSLSHAARPPHWTNTVDDSLRLITAWLVFSTAALVFPLPFLLLKGVSKTLTHFFSSPSSSKCSWDMYTPAALRFNQAICSLILQISALKVEVTDERSPEGLALMSSHRSVTCFNHTSTIDAFVLPAISTHFCFMLAKKELFALPFFSWLMAVFGAIPIDRKDRSSAVMSLELAASCVQPGQSVTISPEGTRSPSGLLLPFKKGPFYLWEALQRRHKSDTATVSATTTGTVAEDKGTCNKGESEGCLVQPVLISDAFALFPPSSLFSAPGVAQVRLLEPIHPSELTTYTDTDTGADTAASLARDRDAMSALLRRRLLQASLLPAITAGQLLDTSSSASSPRATARSTLTPLERALSILTLLLTFLLSLFFFYYLHSSLHSPQPTGLGLSNRQITCWGFGVSIGITAAIFAYYSLKLKRAKRGGGAGEEKKTKTE